jgi:hypothetical protein
MSYRKWIGLVRIYLRYKDSLRKCCWVNMLKDNSFSFGFSSKVFKFTEFGSSIVRSGHFTDESPILTKGNIGIRDTRRPHVSFHPPKLDHKSGIVHLIDDDKKVVSEWELDWFPVRKPDSLLFVYTGNLNALEIVTKPTGRYEEVYIPSVYQFLRIELRLYPNPHPEAPKLVHRKSAISNVHGLCSSFIISCYFYPNPPSQPAVFIAQNEAKR